MPLIPGTLPPFMILGLDTSKLMSSELIVRSEEFGEVGRIRLDVGAKFDTAPNAYDVEQGDAWSPVSSDWILQPLPTRGAWVVGGPGLYKVFERRDDRESFVGSFEVLFAQLPEPSAEELAALRSHPQKASHARMEMGCTACPAKLKAYLGKSRSTDQEAVGWKWAYDIKETEWQCNCGHTRIDLSFLSKSLENALRRDAGGQTIELLPDYDRRYFQNTLTNFNMLISEKPREEKVQKFIENNEILLHHFSAKKIWIKPRIGTKYVADFVILDSRSDLILIEIERPDLPLLTKSGERRKEFNHAVEQVTDWMIFFEDHKHTLLDDFGLQPLEVNKCRGAVIAGRDISENPAHIRKLKRKPTDNVTFFTYDDMMRQLEALIRMTTAAGTS